MKKSKLVVFFLITPLFIAVALPIWLNLTLNGFKEDGIIVLTKDTAHVEKVSSTLVDANVYSEDELFKLGEHYYRLGGRMSAFGFELFLMYKYMLILVLGGNIVTFWALLRKRRSKDIE